LGSDVGVQSAVTEAAVRVTSRLAISRAVDGHYEVDEEDGGNFLAMDLIDMFDLRVLQ